MGFLPISLLDFREQRAQAGAPAQLALVTAAASACRGGRGASSPAGRTSACSLPLPHLRGAIASPSIAAGRHKRYGLVGGHRPWPVRRCCGGRAPPPAACRARQRAVTADGGVFIRMALCWSSVYNLLANMGCAFRRTGSEHRPWQKLGAEEGRPSCRGSCSRDPKKRMLRRAGMLPSFGRRQEG